MKPRTRYALALLIASSLCTKAPFYSQHRNHSQEHLLSVPASMLQGIPLTRRTETPTAPAVGVALEFAGPDSGSVPDSSLAVGIASIVAVTNQTAAIYRKDGTQLATARPSDLLFAGTFNDYRGDPKVVFDRATGRFFISATAGTAKGTAIWLAVSKTGDPLTLTTADWFVYRLPAQYRGSTPTADTIDYPQLGVGTDVVVVATLMIDSTDVIHDEVIRAYSKSDLVSGLSVVSPLADFYGQQYPAPFNYVVREFQPAVHLSASSTFYLLTQGPAACDVTVWGIEQVVNSPMLRRSTVPVSDCDGSASATVPQLGGPAISVGPGGFTHSVFVNGTVWGAKLVRRNYPTGAVIAVMWYQVDVSSWPTVTLRQHGTVSEENVSYAYAAIGADAGGNAVLVLNRFSANSYPTLVYTLRAAADPLGTMRQPVVLKSGSAASTFALGGVYRWGDFSGIDFDPTDGSCWVFGEYTHSDGSGRTWIAKLTVPMAPSVVDQPSSQTIPYNSSANLVVTASGDSPAYQWYQGPSGNTTRPITGATSNSFTTPTLISDKRYWVRVTNSLGTADSNAALVTVNFTDPVLSSAATLIKKQHWDEIAARINAEETRVGRALTSFRTLTAGTSLVVVQDYLDRRAAIETLFSIAGLTPTWHSNPQTGSAISVTELSDLRVNLHTLEVR